MKVGWGKKCGGGELSMNIFDEENVITIGEV